MKCPIEIQETTEILLAYCARRVEPGMRAQLERHIETCPACRHWCAGQRAVWDAMDRWETPPVSAEFNRKLYRAIGNEERSAWWQRLVPSGSGPSDKAWLWRGLPAMAAACLLVVAGAILQNWRLPAVPAATAARVEAVQADQVERTLEDMELLESLNQEVRAAVPSPM